MPPRKPRNWISTLPSSVVLILAIVMYWYGWRVTKIDLKTLIKDVGYVKPIVIALLQPRLLERELFSQSHQIPFQFPCAQTALPAATRPASGSHLTVSPTCGKVGDPITVEGFNLRPTTQGTVYWVIINTRRRLDYITTDANGHFVLNTSIPETRVGDQAMQIFVETELNWRAGPLGPTEALRITVEKMIETIFLALIATTLSIVVAIPLSFLGARNLMGRSIPGTTVYYLTRTFFNLLRSIEPLILAIVFAVWVGIGPFAGVLALAVHSIASIGKLYSEAIESIDAGPIEAITATGANRIQTVIYAVVPQIVPQFIAFTIYRWDMNVRMSTIIGFVGGGGIGFVLQQWINLLQYRNAAVAVWAIAIVVATLDYISAKVREKIV